MNENSLRWEERHTPAHPKVLAASSVKKEGLESLWAEIAFICLEKG
jgi:hypothetical protein